MILKGLGMSYSHLSGILLSIHHAISMRICSNVPEKDICMVGNVDDEANETTSTADLRQISNATPSRELAFMHGQSIPESVGTSTMNEIIIFRRANHSLSANLCQFSQVLELVYFHQATVVIGRFCCHLFLESPFSGA